MSLRWATRHYFKKAQIAVGRSFGVLRQAQDDRRWQIALWGFGSRTAFTTRGCLYGGQRVIILRRRKLQLGGPSACCARLRMTGGGKLRFGGSVVGPRSRREDVFTVGNASLF